MTLLVELTRTIPASCEDVFDAWLSPAAIAAFMCPEEGVQTTDIEIDSREGGAFSLTMLAGEAKIPIHGVYRIVNRPTTLSFTWHSSQTSDESVVTLEFVPAGEHTELTLRHTGFPHAESRDSHNGGWGHIVAKLGDWALAKSSC